MDNSVCGQPRSRRGRHSQTKHRGCYCQLHMARLAFGWPRRTMLGLGTAAGTTSLQEAGSMVSKRWSQLAVMTVGGFRVRIRA